MEKFKYFSQLNAVFATTLILYVVSINGQISSPCSFSMVTSFTPCINFITGSTGNGASPTKACCDSLKSLMSNSMDCTCLIINGNVPVSLPINRTLAISLPRACNSDSVPLKCKASGVPLPAPGPVLFTPPPPPTVAVSPFSPAVSKAPALAPAKAPAETTRKISPALAPAKAPAETTRKIAPASSPAETTSDGIPPTTVNPGIRPVLNPTTSASNPLSSYISSPFFQLASLGIMFLDN